MLSLLDRYTNIDFTIIHLCWALKVPVTPGYIQLETSTHPDYPSMLTISDVLKSLYIDSVSIFTTMSQLKKLQVPIIAQVEINNQKYFTAITKIEGDIVFYYDPLSNTPTTKKVLDFEDIFTGYAMLVESSVFSGEINFTKNIKTYNKRFIKRVLIWSLLPIILVTTCFIGLLKGGTLAILPIIYMLVTILGVGIAILMVWYEFDQFNPVIRQICSKGKKTNCGAILQSKSSKIFGIKWSNIGFVFFSGSLLFLILIGVENTHKLVILAWLNLFALLFLPYSLFYQAKIAKQWCNLCLLTLATLFVQFLILIFSNIYSSKDLFYVPVESIILALTSYIIPIIGLYLIVPALQKAKKYASMKREFSRLKLNPIVFQALLENEKLILDKTDGLGITIGNRNASHKIVKVCSPYCGPCANTHQMLEELMNENEDICLQIIYNATGNVDDRATKPVQHFMSIAAENNEKRTVEMLNEWYQSENKDYLQFAVKYKVAQADIEVRNNSLVAMFEWCKNTDIRFTPTLFVDGKQLPEYYSIADLKYFLADKLE